MICAGIDAGSRAIKIVLMDVVQGRALAADMVDQATDQAAHARQLFDRLLDDSGLAIDDVGFIVATGYARHLLAFAHKTVTEITCHARGVRQHVPEVRSVIEIGGQDSKVIRLDEQGRVEDFTMNDRCAAGTGCFLELVARRLDVDLQRLGAMAARSAAPATISSMCAVFAETEIIGLLASGQAADDIAAGVQRAVARRVAAMAGRALRQPIVFTGGVARAHGMADALRHALDAPVHICAQPQMTGALGAALLAAEHLRANA
ncbi:MAG: acyl-CoA dehydratase activase [Phycisphaeraceae bacterium]